MKSVLSLIVLILFSFSVNSSDLHVYGIGVYDVRFDGGEDNQTIDLRYERRFDDSIFEIGPEEDNFFFLKPFLGFEYTGDSAYYILSGLYFEDNIGELTNTNNNNILFTPSIGVGFYENGSGRDLGNSIQFRTTLEFSYILKNKNRIGLSLGHISNANLSSKNPGVEIISLSYQVPY
tara:strand:+ start:659 stop:1189 length:531 start_codon:yes stop_codon:yes gene_type:complete